MTDKELKDIAIRIVCYGFDAFIKKLYDSDEFENLKPYLPDDNADENVQYRWSEEKAKVVFEILKLRGNDVVENILTYTKQSEYGWQGNTYRLYNQCLLYGHYCKEYCEIENSPEVTEDVFSDINYIFLHSEYGPITLYLFCYSLAALFSSILKKDHLRIPYFLQIACESNSNVYKLIHEIVDICDVNSGVVSACNKKIFGAGNCEYTHITIFPTQSSGTILNDLMYHRDLPIVIDGFDNDKYYDALLHEVVNIPARIKDLDIKNRFNTLPIFVNETIRGKYRNMFSIDLKNLDIDDAYIWVIQKNKRLLASLVYKLIVDAGERFSKAERNIDSYNRRLFAPVYFRDLNSYVDNIRISNRSCNYLSRDDLTNIGLLSYIWSKFMSVFRSSIRLSNEVPFIYKGENKIHNRDEIIKSIKSDSQKYLIKLHNIYSPQLISSFHLDETFTEKEISDQHKAKAKMYAKNIIKYYESFKVLIGISSYYYKDDRYIFFVALKPGTDKHLLGRYSDEIRRLLDVKFLFTDISDDAIKLIVSERPLWENSLIKLLKCDDFQHSKMVIPYAIGYDMQGEKVFADVSKFSHVIIGGASRSGKSSALHSLLMSIIWKQSPKKVKLLILDFGASRLRMFEKTPHMLAPVVSANGVDKGRKYIMKLQQIMEERLQRLDESSERDYDKVVRKWPWIICVIDEFPKFIRQLTMEKEHKNDYMIIVDLLERARKIKIHLVLAVQDATKGNIMIKTTNFSTAIALRCNTIYDSRALIQESDAVNLPGDGAMYFRCDQYNGIKRLQGSYIEPVEIMDVLDEMDYIYDETNVNYEEVRFDLKSSDNRLEENETEKDIINEADKETEILIEIILLALQKGKISNKLLKDNLHIGYDKAKVYIERLENAGVIPRRVGDSKLARLVDSDKAKSLMRELGYEDNGKKIEPSQNHELLSEQEKEELEKIPNRESNIDAKDSLEEENAVNTLFQERERLNPNFDTKKLKELIYEARRNNKSQSVGSKNKQRKRSQTK